VVLAKGEQKGEYQHFLIVASSGAVTIGLHELENPVRMERLKKILT